MSPNRTSHAAADVALRLMYGRARTPVVRGVNRPYLARSNPQASGTGCYHVPPQGLSDDIITFLHLLLAIREANGRTLILVQLCLRL
jgi:hypothetical protein